MNTYTNIDASKKPFDPTGGQQRLQAPAAQNYRNPAVQQAFSDAYTPAAQQAAVDFGRQSSAAAADYRQAARQGQYDSALAGLQLLGTQQQNAYQRDQAMQKMGYGMMSDMMGGMTNLLGGLL